jgi:hypothetical protein
MAWTGSLWSEEESDRGSAEAAGVRETDRAIDEIAVATYTRRPGAFARLRQTRR